VRIFAKKILTLWTHKSQPIAFPTTFNIKTGQIYVRSIILNTDHTHAVFKDHQESLKKNSTQLIATRPHYSDKEVDSE